MTGTDVAVATRTDLTIAADQQGWTDDQVAVLRQIGTEKATAADLKLFFHQCARTGLDPFARQIYLVEYGGKATIQTGIDGFRLVARRAADAAGESLEYEDTQWCGPDGKWTDVWLSDEPPAAARTVVLRGGRRFPAVALYREFVGLKNEYGPDKRATGRKVPNAQWTSKPAHMLGKCAEASALRRAFPQDLGGVYEPAELDHRTVVAGEVVVERTAGPADPDAALQLVAAATTRDELLAIWEQHASGLSVTARARLQKACQDAAAALEPTADPGGQPDVVPAAVSGELGEALAEAGWISAEDQMALAARVLGHPGPGNADEVLFLLDHARAAVASGDPQAYFEDLIPATP